MKLSVVDVKAVDQRGHSYATEAQVHHHKGFVERTALYVAGLYRDQTLKGSAYVDVRPAICIAILEFDLFEQSEKLNEIFEFRNLDNTITLSDTMALHYIAVGTERRRLKGGFFGSPATNVTTVIYGNYPPHNRASTIGFRVVRRQL